MDHADGNAEPLTRGDERNLQYPFLNHHSWRGYVVSEYADPSTLDCFTTLHEAIHRGDASVFYNLTERTVAMITPMIQGRPVPLVVKQDNLAQSGFRTLLKNHIRPSRPQITWQRMIQLRAAGVAVPPLVALLECRRYGVLRAKVYVEAYIPHTVSVTHALQGSADVGTDRDKLLTVLARELRKMHDKGFYHGDLKADNILAEHRAAGWSITFIDLEDVTAKRYVTENERAIDLGRLWWALLPMTTPVEREQFLEAYASITPVVDPALLRRLIDQRVDYLKTRRFDDLPRIGATLRDKRDQLQRWLIIALEPPQKVLQMTPLLARLRQSFPAIQIDLLVGGGVVPPPVRNLGVRAIISVSGESMMQTIRTLRSTHYQVAIDLTNSARSAILTRATGAGVRIGYRTASTVSKWLKRATCYTQMILARREQRDPVQHYLLVAEALGLGGAISEPAGVSENRLEPTHAVLRSHS